MCGKLLFSLPGFQPGGAASKHLGQGDQVLSSGLVGAIGPVGESPLGDLDLSGDVCGADA